MVPVESKLLFVIEQREEIVELCLGTNHLVVVGTSGRCYWLGFPIKMKKVKIVEVVSKKKAKKMKGPKVPEVIEDEYEPIDPHDYRIVEEIHLSIGPIVSAQYRRDEKQLLLGSSEGSIITIEVDAANLRTLIETKVKPEEASDKLVEIIWESRFHNGPIMAMSYIKLVT